MVGSQLPWTWLAVGVLVLVVPSLFLLVRRRTRIEREQRARAEKEEREQMESRIADVKATPPLSVPPSMHSDPREVWTRHTPNRFSRRGER